MTRKIEQMKFDEIRMATVARYEDRFREYGYSPLTLGWNKGKQFERFHQLTSDWNMENSSVLDVGCGFGDFLKYINLNKEMYRNLIYTGIDITPILIENALKENVVLLDKTPTFLTGDFMNFAFDDPFDYCIASGVFNHKYENIDKYEYLFSAVSRMFELTNVAMSIDLLSDKVDYQLEHTFHYNPCKVLEMAYSLSRNVVLKNNHFPFEFAITIYKDDSFDKETTMFRYARELGY